MARFVCCACDRMGGVMPFFPSWAPRWLLVLPTEAPSKLACTIAALAPRVHPRRATVDRAACVPCNMDALSENAPEAHPLEELHIMSTVEVRRAHFLCMRCHSQNEERQHQV